VTDRGIIASITGRAFVTAEARLIMSAEDSFADGFAGAHDPIRASGFA
jgi:proline racemase